MPTTKEELEEHTRINNLSMEDLIGELEQFSADWRGEKEEEVWWCVLDEAIMRLNHLDWANEYLKRTMARLREDLCQTIDDAMEYSKPDG